MTQWAREDAMFLLANKFLNTMEHKCTYSRVSFHYGVMLSNIWS